MALWAQDTWNHVGSAIQKGGHVLEGALGAYGAVKGIVEMGGAMARGAAALRGPAMAAGVVAGAVL
jgi:hypothetical protein